MIKAEVTHNHYPRSFTDIQPGGTFTKEPICGGDLDLYDNPIFVAGPWSRDENEKLTKFRTTTRLVCPGGVENAPSLDQNEKVYEVEITALTVAVMSH